QHSGIVDGDVQPAVTPDRLTAQIRHLATVGDVGRDRVGGAPLSLDPLHRLLQDLRAPSRHHHPGPATGEGDAGGPSDPGAPAGDYGDLALELDRSVKNWPSRSAEWQRGLHRLLLGRFRLPPVGAPPALRV